MHKAFPLSVKSSYCQKKFPLLVNKVPPAEEKRCHCSEDCTAIEDREFEDSYEAPNDVVATGSATKETSKKKGRTVALTTKDIQKRKNDVKARTTLLLAFPDEHQLRFSKYKTAQELWATILKTFDGNEATKKMKKILLKWQYGNFKAEGLETLEQTFNRLQAIVSHLQFMDIEIEQDDLNQKFLTSLAPEWLMHTIVWRNRSDLDTMSLDDYTIISSVKEDVNSASIPTASTNVSPTSVNIGAVNIRKKISIQGTDVAGFDKLKVECFNCHKIGHFTRECRAYRSQDRGRRDNYRQEEDHALVADEETLTKFALMAKTSVDSETGLLEFADDTVTDYSRPSPAIESTSNDVQNRNPSVTKTEALPSIISFKPFIKFVKTTDRPTKDKTNKVKTAKKPTVKYAELYRKTTKRSNVRDHRSSWEKNNNTHKSKTPRTVFHKTSRPPMRINRPYMNAAQPKRTSFYKPAHSYNKRPFQRTSTNHIDDKGYWDSGCPRHMTGNISYLFDYEPYDRRTPRQHNMYTIDLNNIVPYKDLTCLVAKSSVDKCMLWHRRLGHLNFKTMNKLVRHNLVRGLPTKCFENDHNCTACLKGKQHKASCKTKLVNSITKPLHTLHMDLFGPTSVSSLNHKWYCLVVTNDFSRFTWTFFLKTKDETSGILRNFITGIENLKELRVKIIRCDNGGEFRNKETNDFCSRKCIKREFSNARTPQQNGVAERRNRTLIEAARTMLADAKFPVTFWVEAVNTACYVQNRVLVNKSQNKTPYELFIGRTPVIGFLKPFGGHVMILNTLDNLRKFEAKGDEGIKEVAGQDVKKDVSSLRYIFLPNWFHETHLETSTSNAQDAYNADDLKSSGNSNPTATSTNPLTDHMETLALETLIPTVSSPVPTAYLNDSLEPSNDTRLISKRVTSQDDTLSFDNILTLTNRFEDILVVTTNTDDTNGVEANIGNMETTITSKEMEEQSFIATIHQKTNLTLLQFCLFSYFLSQVKPKKISNPLQDSSWVEAMQEELLQFKIQNVWSLIDYPKGVRPIGIKWVLKNKKDERGIVIRNKARLVAQGHTKEEGIDYDEVFAPVARIEAIRLFLAYASFMGFTVYQMDVKSAFLYGTIDEEVYVMQPPGFQDLEFPARVYKVEKAIYRLLVKEYQEKDKIRSKPDKNRKHGEAEK
nr:putative ribonuclease H-like domain-containing protein [Tanacetum cinerariifolium]